MELITIIVKNILEALLTWDKVEKVTLVRSRSQWMGGADTFQDNSATGMARLDSMFGVGDSHSPKIARSVHGYSQDVLNESDALYHQLNESPNHDSSIGSPTHNKEISGSRNSLSSMFLHSRSGRR